MVLGDLETDFISFLFFSFLLLMRLMFLFLARFRLGTARMMTNRKSTVSVFPKKRNYNDFFADRSSVYRANEKAASSFSFFLLFKMVSFPSRIRIRKSVNHERRRRAGDPAG